MFCLIISQIFRMQKYLHISATSSSPVIYIAMFEKFISLQGYRLHIKPTFEIRTIAHQSTRQLTEFALTQINQNHKTGTHCAREGKNV